MGELIALGKICAGAVSISSEKSNESVTFSTLLVSFPVK